MSSLDRFKRDTTFADGSVTHTTYKIDLAAGQRTTAIYSAWTDHTTRENRFVKAQPTILPTDYFALRRVNLPQYNTAQTADLPIRAYAKSTSPKQG